MHQHATVILNRVARPAGGLEFFNLKRCPLRCCFQFLNDNRFPFFLLNGKRALDAFLFVLPGFHLILQLRPLRRLRPTQWQVQFRAIEIPCHPAGILHLKRRVVEKGKQLVILLHRNRVILVIVALRTLKSRTEEHCSGGVHPVDDLIDAIRLGMHPRLDVAGGCPVKTGGDLLGEGCPG